MMNYDKIISTDFGAGDEIPKPTDWQEIKKESFEFSRQQEALYQALVEKTPELARMYKGALIVLINRDNPEHLCHSAHSIRELMEKAPIHFNLPRIPKEPLPVKVNALEEKWQPLEEHVNDNGLCNIPENNKTVLERFLSACKTFFTWRKTFQPRRLNKAAEMLRGFDPHEIALPEHLEKRRIKQWDNINDYFIYVAHHNKLTDYDEFISWLNKFENFFLDRLCPRAFEDHRNIDSIIEEGNDQVRDN